MSSNTSSSFKNSDESESSKWYRGIRILCASLIFLFILTTSFQICAIVLGGKFSKIATGIWCGCLYLITGVFGFINAGSSQKAKKIGLIFMGALSCFASLALIALSSLSLTSVFPEVFPTTRLDSATSKALWISCNGILIGLGIVGFLINMVLAFIIGLNVQTKNKVFDDNDGRREIMEMENNNSSTAGSSHNAIETYSYPRGEVVAVIKPNYIAKLANGSISSKNSSGFYETIDSIVRKTIEQRVDKALANTEPIYALPIKEEKRVSISQENGSNIPAAGDFEIVMDTRPVDSPMAVKKYFTNDDYDGDSFSWYVSEEQYQQQRSAKTDSDDDEESQHLSKNITLSKEDFIIHAPPIDNTRQFTNSIIIESY